MNPLRRQPSSNPGDKQRVGSKVKYNGRLADLQLRGRYTRPCAGIPALEIYSLYIDSYREQSRRAGSAETAECGGDSRAQSRRTVRRLRGQTVSLCWRDQERAG